MAIELLENLKEGLEEAKDNFLDSAIGTAVDKGINFGLRCILPEFAEDAVIGLKDKILDSGLGDTIVDGVKGAIDTGKNVVKNVAENISDSISNVKKIQEAVSDLGIRDSVSDILDDILDKIEKAGDAGSSVIDMIKDGKEAILINIDKNINSTLSKQIKGLENIEKYMENWKEAFANKDFKTMEKEYNKMERKLKEIIPIENTISDARNIELLHNLIKNNGKDFDLSDEELKLAEKLSL